MTTVTIYNKIRGQPVTTGRVIESFSGWENFMMDEHEFLFKDEGKRKALIVRFWHTVEGAAQPLRQYLDIDYLKLPKEVRRAIDAKEASRRVHRYPTQYQKGYVVAKITSAKLRANVLKACVFYAAEQPDGTSYLPHDAEWVEFTSLTNELKKNFEKKFTMQGKRKRKRGRPTKKKPFPLSDEEKHKRRKENDVSDKLPTPQSVKTSEDGSRTLVVNKDQTRQLVLRTVTPEGSNKKPSPQGVTPTTTRKEAPAKVTTAVGTTVPTVDVDLTSVQKLQERATQVSPHFALNHLGKEILNFLAATTFSTVKAACTLRDQAVRMERGKKWQETFKKHYVPIEDLLKEAQKAISKELPRAK